MTLTLLGFPTPQLQFFLPTSLPRLPSEAGGILNCMEPRAQGVSPTF